MLHFLWTIFSIRFIFNPSQLSNVKDSEVNWNNCILINKNLRPLPQKCWITREGELTTSCWTHGNKTSKEFLFNLFCFKKEKRRSWKEKRREEPEIENKWQKRRNKRANFVNLDLCTAYVYPRETYAGKPHTHQNAVSAWLANTTTERLA